MRSFLRWILGEDAASEQSRKIWEQIRADWVDYNALAKEVAYNAVMNAIKRDWTDNWHPDKEDWSINYRPQED